MTTVTIQEAEGHWPELVHRAFCGEEIAISTNQGAVKLQPIALRSVQSEMDPVVEAFEWFEKNPTLSDAEAEAYLEEVRAERRAHL